MSKPRSSDNPHASSGLKRLQELRDAASRSAPSTARASRDQDRWTAREAIAALSDIGTFIEYGGLVRPVNKQMEGPADGLITGVARLDGKPLVLAAYDYNVYGGSQSAMNHRKLARIVAHAAKHRLPLVGWLEGAGARPHDMVVDARGPTSSLVEFARLSGWVPTIGIVPGRAFAGHANLAGMCDVLIVTRDATMGLAGPPLVEAALGVKLTPEEIGPAKLHVDAGVVDFAVADAAEAVATARKYLSYFSERHVPGEAPDPESLRDIVPNNPRHSYDVRKVIDGIADVGSVLELKAEWGRSLVTSLTRIGGFTVGVVANQPLVMAGAIDAAAAAKAVRFVQLCDAFDIPLLMLCDTPGLHVGPDVEKTGLVRQSARWLIALANSTTMIMTVVLRKGYGLGHYIMGSMPFTPSLLVAWPNAEFGGMGLEGAVNIIHRRRLEAIEDAGERASAHAQLTAELREANTAFAVAERFLVDDVIDPADTRIVLTETLASWKPHPSTKRKRIIDSF